MNVGRKIGLNKLLRVLLAVCLLVGSFEVFGPAPQASAADEGAFVEAGGAVTIEAETAAENSEYAYTNARGGAEWAIAAGSSGSSMWASPDVGGFFNAPQNENAPELTYKVNFSTAGSYNVWILYKAPNTGADSVYAGFGDELKITNTSLSTGSSFGWRKIGTFAGIGSGYVDINFWAREDGLYIDKIYLTTGTDTPTGTGAAESDREPIAPPEPGAWLEAGGQLSIEAEAAAENSDYAYVDARGGADWTVVAGSSGDAMWASPDSGAFFNPPQNENAPELTYKAKFSTAGNYKVWLLYKAPNTGADSVYVGLNDTVLFTNTSLSTGSTYKWKNVGTITGIAAGYADLNFWAREDGLYLDKIYLTTDTDTPTGTGPASSEREDANGNPTNPTDPTDPTDPTNPTNPTSPCDSQTTETSPVSGTVLIDSCDSSIVYQGAWSYSGTTVSNYGEDQYYSNSTNNYAELQFTGTQVYWFAPQSSNKGKAEIYIDGTLDQVVDLYSSAETSKQTVYSRTDLSPGTHTIRVAVAATKNAASTDYYVSIDAFAVEAAVTPTPPPAGSGDRYVTPGGAGTKDGSSWANAMAGNRIDGLQAAWDAAGDTGTVYVGGGTYDVPQFVNLRAGDASASAPKTLLGVDRGDGLPEFIGDFSHTSQRRGTLIEIASGVSYWVLEDIRISHYYYGIETKGRNIGYRISNVDVSYMSDGFYLRGGATAADGTIGSHGILIEDSDFKYYTKRGIRFLGGNYDATVNRCTADAGGEAYWVTGNYPFSFQVADSEQAAGIIDHDITFNDCEGRNNYQNNGTGYWNGDSFVSEWNSDNITYNRCKAFDNTDGGWDVKAAHTYLNDCIAVGNKRGFRIWSTGEAVLTNCVAAYSDSYGAWIGATSDLSKRANVILHNTTFVNNGYEEFRCEGGIVTAYDSVFADTISTVRLYDKIDGGNYTFVDSVAYGYVNGTTLSGTDPQFVNPTNESWTGVGTDFNNQLYGSSKGYYQPTPSNILPSAPRTLPISAPDRYMTPTGAGTMDGSSWANALSADAPNALQSAWNQTAATGTLYIGSGSYTGQKITIASGGTSTSSPKRIAGVDTGSGLPVFTGSFTRYNQATGNFIDVSAGASYWVVQDLKINNYFNGIYTRGRNVGIRIYNVDISEMSDGIYLNGGATAADGSIASHDIVIEDSDFTYYTKRGIRFRGGNYDAVVNRCTADAGGAAYWITGNFPFGFQVADSSQDPAIVDHDITFNDSVSSNNYQDAGPSEYWNADGFVAEAASDYITFNRSVAFGNTDGGWDLKAAHAYVNDSVSYGNKRAYRFWGGESELRNSIAYGSVEPGGMPTAAGVWAGSLNSVAANVYIYNSEIYNNTGPELLVEGGNITCYECIVSEGRAVTEDFTAVDPVKLGTISFVDSAQYYPGATGTNPQYVLKSLEVDPGALSFDPETTSYSLTVPGTAASILITPTAASRVYQSLTVNGNPAVSGSAISVPLDAGLNEIVIELTAHDDNVRSYVLQVNRM
ncbi:cadherin-like beta sandwich domain-containing protein [Cohnella fermenti]|uniref:Cadherin-like beta sandwich domain-containing protein n=1 Tax=Cohnella fermenti TaxID=2565925 RepID=A0A4S4BF52_9BACL|nr:cadherin-like beta sandwich domain-containing protein [Cohnella fermenti]THF72901.1 cadherin-like beta sandwich domain-containing protein [Cohnella fermenti]